MKGFTPAPDILIKTRKDSGYATSGCLKHSGEKNLTETEAKALISGKATKPKGYKWKNGTTSFTGLVLDKSTFKISFAEKESIGKCPKCGGTIFAGKTGITAETGTKKMKQEIQYVIFPFMVRSGKRR